MTDRACCCWDIESLPVVVGEHWLTLALSLKSLTTSKALLNAGFWFLIIDTSSESIEPLLGGWGVTTPGRGEGRGGGDKQLSAPTQLWTQDRKSSDGWQIQRWWRYQHLHWVSGRRPGVGPSNQSQPYTAWLYSLHWQWLYALTLVWYILMTCQWFYLSDHFAMSQSTKPVRATWPSICGWRHNKGSPSTRQCQTLDSDDVTKPTLA